MDFNIKIIIAIAIFAVIALVARFVFGIKGSEVDEPMDDDINTNPAYKSLPSNIFHDKD